MVQRDVVDAGVDAARREQRGQGGGEAQRAAGLGDVQRLDAEAVAGEHDAPAALLDQREGEHALEAVEHALAPRRPAVQQHLGVGGRAEARATRLELGAQLVVVVDAAVEGDGEAEVVVDHRLRAALARGR